MRRLLAALSSGSFTCVGIVMNTGATSRLAGRARYWAIALTERKSVTGTDGEAAFGLWLADELRRETAFRHAETWTIEVEPGDRRHCVAMLVRGTGRTTVVLTGHYDTVTTRDYGDLEDLATQPQQLTQALSKALAMADAPAARRARDDFVSGEFLAGRGLLDMKAGLAAGLAVCAELAESPDPAGNLLFIAVPDEEKNSAGARKAAQALPRLLASAGSKFWRRSISMRPPTTGTAARVASSRSERWASCFRPPTSSEFPRIAVFP